MFYSVSGCCNERHHEPIDSTQGVQDTVHKACKTVHRVCKSGAALMLNGVSRAGHELLLV